MFLYKILLLSLLILNSGYALSSNNDWKIRASIKLKNYKAELKELTKRDIDIAGVDYKEKVVDILINDEQYQNLQNQGYDLEIQEVKGVTLGPDSEYKNPQEIEDFLKSINSRFPNLTKLISIGKSLEGRDIWAIKISDNADLDEYYDEPAVLFNSMHHAREVMTPEVGIDIIEFLLDNYNNDTKVTEWINSTEIWVIPMFNVDGNNKMWNEDAWWRKNTRGGFGVDLNRNYPAGWNSCEGSSGNRSSQTYRGEFAASEPETQAMMNFVANVRPVFDISYHAFSELVIYPFGCDGQRTQTKEVVETIGNRIGELIDYDPGTAWELLYSVDGGDIDWMYQEYQVIPYVIEVNSRWQGFHPNYKRWRNKTVERNRAGWQYLLERVSQSAVRGQVTLNNKAISEYQIIVNKIVDKKKSLFQNYKGHKSGMFHLILNPGKYELKFKFNDFEKVETVVVDQKVQHLDVNL